MRSSLYLSFGLILSIALLTGCGGGAASGTGTTTPPPPPPTYVASAAYAYVSTTAGFVDQYSISTRGQWTLIGSGIGTPGNIGSTTLAIDPNYRFVYEISGGDANSIISMFSITPATGVLVPTSPASITIAGCPIHRAASCAMGGLHAAAGRRGAAGGTTKLPSSTSPIHSTPTTHASPARLSSTMRANNYLDELISYGGIPTTHAEAILDMQRLGATQQMIDRWLHGYELAQRLRERNTRLAPRVFLAELPRRTRKLCR